MKTINEIKNLIDLKFNNKFDEFVRVARHNYIKCLSEYNAKPWDIRDFANWKLVETTLINEIPNLYNYICRYDDSMGIPEEGIISLYIDIEKDDDFNKIYYFSSGDIHKISVELSDGTIEEGLEEFYF